MAEAVVEQPQPDRAIEAPVKDGNERTEKADESEQQADAETAATKLGGPEQQPPKMAIELHGDQFLYRSSDRAKKQFKGHFLENV